MQQEAVDMLIPQPMMPQEKRMQTNWLLFVCVPLGSISFKIAMGGREALAKPLVQSRSWCRALERKATDVIHRRGAPCRAAHALPRVPVLLPVRSTPQHMRRPSNLFRNSFVYTRYCRERQQVLISSVVCTFYVNGRGSAAAEVVWG